MGRARSLSVTALEMGALPDVSQIVKLYITCRSLHCIWVEFYQYNYRIPINQNTVHGEGLIFSIS